MAILKRFELARQYCSTVGAGPLVLGSAVPGYLTYAQAGAVNGDNVTYSIRDGANSEVGWGPYGAGPSIGRNVLKSTNNNLPLDLSGSAEVFCGVHANDFGTGPNQALLLDDNGKIPAVDGTQIAGLVKTAGDTMTGGLAISPPAGAAFVQLTPPAGSPGAISATNAAQVARWQLNIRNAVAESGGNSGSDFSLFNFADNGAQIGTPLTIRRSDGLATLTGDVMISKSFPTLSLNRTGNSQASVIFGQTNGVNRWRVHIGDATTESGTNSGSDFSLTRYNDAGTAIDVPIFCQRSSGILALGKDANAAIDDVTCQVSMRYTNRGITLRSTQGGTNSAFVFINNSGSVIGSIDTSVSGTAYQVSSDIRLKTDIEPFSNGREILDRLAVKNFTWKESRQRDTGLIAQEVADIYPQAVGVGHGEPGEEGFMPYQIDNSKLVPVLIQALQEAFRKIDALEARLEQRSA